MTTEIDVGSLQVFVDTDGPGLFQITSALRTVIGNDWEMDVITWMCDPIL